jgi:hypothetical protein
LEQLAAKVSELRARREELVVAIQQVSLKAPDADELAATRGQIEKSLKTGSVPARKTLLQALVHEIRVEGRDRIVPWFRVPGGADPKVRALARSAPPAGLEPATHGLGIGSSLSSQFPSMTFRQVSWHPSSVSWSVVLGICGV